MATLTRAKTWAAGETLTASDLNAEFDNALSTINGNLNAANLGVTAGVATASKALVLDANRDLANASTSNQIRNLTLSGDLKVGSTFLPDASGGADLGSATLEWGDFYVADDKYLYMGSDQNIKIGYDETTTDSLARRRSPLNPTTYPYNRNQRRHRRRRTELRAPVRRRKLCAAAGEWRNGRRRGFKIPSG